MSPLRTLHPFPAHPAADSPPEARGLRRDGVSLMVSHYLSDDLVHTRFNQLPTLLSEGDVLVINTSSTLPAALEARHQDGRRLRVHLSTRLSEQRWVVEVRTPSANGSSLPFAEVKAGDQLLLEQGASLTLLEAYSMQGLDPELAYETGQERRLSQSPRLWLARPEGFANWLDYLYSHGRAIRYGYVSQDWPLEAYQTVYALDPGSAEMPSAGRAFTSELLTALVAKGVLVVPLVLHTGVSSLESAEAPYAEYYRIPELTAAAVNLAKAQGRRIIGVGTTAVRALESAIDPEGLVQAGSGWTQLMITPERGMRVVSGLLTGFHEPEATHLAMLEALAGEDHLRLSYAAALEQGYLWHEFGDLHLLIP